MKIIINGQVKEVVEKITAHDLLQQLDLLEKKLAIEINEAIVPRSELSEYVIQPDDRIEIIHAIGGG